MDKAQEDIKWESVKLWKEMEEKGKYLEIKIQNTLSQNNFLRNLKENLFDRKFRKV